MTPSETDLLERAGANAVPGSGRMGRRPRVFHLCNYLHYGGTEKQAVELLLRLNPDRYDVRLGVIQSGGSLFDCVRRRFGEIPEFRLTSFYRPHAVRQTLRLCALLKRERIDILHAHDFYAGLLGGLAARLAGVRFLAAQRHIRLSDRRVHEWGQRLIQRLAHCILVNSEAIRDHIVKGGGAPPEKIVVIRNGLVFPEDPARQAQAARQEVCSRLGLPRQATLVGTVARLQPVKGHCYLVEAARIVCRERTDVHFVFVGDGPLQEDLRRQIAGLGLSGRVHLFGACPDGASMAGAFDLAVLSSLHEGLPNAVMEAMSAGVPVVATGVGGTRELVADGRTGWLAPPADPEALARRILYALDNQTERAVVASNARAMMVSRFHVSRMVREVERLYDSLMR